MRRVIFSLCIEYFVSGWLVSASNALGRPVDLVFGPDDALYVSDDKAAVIYRIISPGFHQ